jgi:hypothetical protein
MKGLLVGIYESKEFGNSSNGGISGRVKSVILCGKGIPEIFESCSEHPAVLLDKKMGNYLYCYPAEGKNSSMVGWMMGGAFVYSSDSRFPSDYPIPLHDRQETQELADILSR